MIKIDNSYLKIFIIILLLIPYATQFIFNQNDLGWQVSEDQLFENLSAIWYLLAAVILFYIWFKYKGGNDFVIFKLRRNVFFFLLGFLFIVCCGEEISWGQRILGFETPEGLKEINAQDEFTFHNLSYFQRYNSEGEQIKGFFTLFSPSKLLFYFWITYCIIIPILFRKSLKMKSLLVRINMPIVPIWLGLMFLFNYLLSHLIALTNVFSWAKPYVEVKETNVGFLFLIVGISFIQKYLLQIKTNADD